MKIENITQKNVVGGNIRVAHRFFDRLRGLIGSKPLENDEGLLIPHCQGIHMFGMSYAIDAVYLDRNHRVIRVSENLKPNCVGPVEMKAEAVLELPAGKIKNASISVGDCLYLSDCGENVN